MTIVYDSRRKQLVFLSRDGEGASQLWFFPLAEHGWIRNPSPAPGGVSTREAVYIEAADAILAYGPAREDDPVWTRASTLPSSKATQELPLRRTSCSGLVVRSSYRAPGGGRSYGSVPSESRNATAKGNLPFGALRV